MKAFIDPPKHIPLSLKINIWISKKVTNHDLLSGRIMAWYPKAANGGNLPLSDAAIINRKKEAYCESRRY